MNRRVDIPEDIKRFQKALQYARSRVDYVIGEFIYMLLSDMIASPSFKTGTNLKINLDGEKDKPDVKPKKEPNIEFDKESKPDTHKITYEEEKVALVLGITTIFTLLWMFK